MNFDYLRTIHGIAATLQIAIGLAAILACSFIWSDGNVFFQFFFSGYPAQIYVLLALFATWMVNLGITFLQFTGKDVLESMGKLKVIIVHAVCLVVILIAAALDSYYVSSHVAGSYYFSRLVVVMIFCWLLVVTYAVQIGYVFLQ